MTGTLTFYDAAWPPAQVPQTTGVCIYIGGDTPHIWSLAEIAAQTARFRLPVFVRSNPGTGPGAAADVTMATGMLQLIGAPKGKLVAWDMETAADAAYIRGVYTDLTAAGYKLIVYGSQSSVMGNDNPDGLYWGADWTGTQHFAGYDVMTQFVSFAGYDESLAQSSLPFWDTHPAPQPTWQEAMMSALPTLQQGDKDAGGQPLDVHRVQLLVSGIGGWNNLGTITKTTVDGVFGPSTTAGVKRVQQFFGLTQDGVVGPLTWTALVTGAA